MRRMVALHGARQWSVIAEQLPGRVGKQCRERCEKFVASVSRPEWDGVLLSLAVCLFARVPVWIRSWQNHLSPDVRKGPWSEKEEETLIKAHRYAIICGPLHR